jgi:toxin ParE1/3/4
MTTRFSVAFTPRAERQLDSLYSYIADRSGTARAERFVGRIVAACESLRTSPERGTKRDDIRPNLRTMGYARRVTIAFSADTAAKIVAIHGVFYGGQDFRDSARRQRIEKPHAFTFTRSAPRPRINVSNSGKLVAIIEASSTVTGSRDASPITRKLMAMR